MLYRGADLIRDLEFVIFDEVHYVNDAEVCALTRGWCLFVLNTLIQILAWSRLGRSDHNASRAREYYTPIRYSAQYLRIRRMGRVSNHIFIWKKLVAYEIYRTDGPKRKIFMSYQLQKGLCH
jgi:hypothetical protein